MKPIAKIASAAAFVASLFATSAASAQSQDRPESEPLRPNRALLISGAAVIAASYTPAVVVAATSGREGDQFLYVPIAGPWIDLADRGGCGPNPCGEEAVYKTLLVATGIAHLVGTGLVISSFIVPDDRERARTAASTKPVVTPTRMGRDGAGLAVVGRF